MGDNRKAQLLVWWMLWLAFQTGGFFFYQFLGGSGSPATAEDSGSSLWAMGFVPFAASAIVRWIILPRLRSATTSLPLFVVGIALAETCCFLGLFIFPAHKQELFVLSVVGIAQFVPIFAGRYFSDARRGNL